MNVKEIQQARSLLESVTPLKQDCGEHCGAACCREDPEGEEILGMELFPGERALYPKKANWFRVYQTPGGEVFVCKGACPREQRPFACRIFPLAPRVTGAKMSAVIDRRAKVVCPLYSSGKTGLSVEFVQQVERAFALLWENPQMREYMTDLSRRIAEQTMLW